MARFSTITFNEKYADDFFELNREWIETYFRIEPLDIKQLKNPKEIISQGGEIFFILDGDHAIGTCALIQHGQDSYELAKMAVSPRVRGKGAGDVLMLSAIDWAKKKKAKSITLISNTILTPAITLYKKHGFETARLGQHPDYERGDIEMVLFI